MVNKKTGDNDKEEKPQNNPIGNQDKDNLKCKRVWKFITSKGICASFVPLIVSVIAVTISALALNTANTGLIATTRPYLSVESIKEIIGDEYISVLIGVTNYGKLPATGVGVTKILLDGVQWMDADIIETPEEAYTTEDGVTITTSGIVVWGLPPERRDFPNSIIFYPKKRNTFVVTVSKDKWESSITTGSVMEIKLNYSWGKHDYWYIATSMLEPNGKWNISLERGD